VGVTVFLLVSGYAITYAIEKNEPWVFAIKRIFRIYPLYVTAVLLQTAFMFFFHGKPLVLAHLIPQLLLLGDFFHSPYALSGMEWTLRVLILFYILMAALGSIGAFEKNCERVPFYYFFASIGVLLLGCVPMTGDWSNGLVSINIPLLLIGSLIYLKEFGKCRTDIFVILTSSIFALHCYLAYSFNPGILVEHLALKSLLIFLVAWLLRKKLPALAAIILMSDLAYAVYLFHNWSWNPIKKFLQQMVDQPQYLDVMALIAVFIISYLMLILIERPGIKLGRKVIDSFRLRLKS